MRPICPHCNKAIEQLALWVDSGKRTVILFCPECSKVLGVHVLSRGEEDL